MKNYEEYALHLKTEYYLTILSENEVLISNNYWAGENFTIKDDLLKGYLAKTIKKIINSKSWSQINLKDKKVEELVNLLIENNLLEKKSKKIGRIVVFDNSSQKNLHSKLKNNNLNVVEGTKDIELKNKDLVVAFSNNYSRNLFEKINSKCIEHKIPFLIAYICGNAGSILLTEPQNSCCFGCYERRLESNITKNQRMFSERNFEKITSENNIEVEIMTSLIKKIIHELITEEYCVFLGTEGLINFRDFSITKHKVLKLPRCPDCSPKHLEEPHHQKFIGITNLIK